MGPAPGGRAQCPAAAGRWPCSGRCSPGRPVRGLACGTRLLAAAGLALRGLWPVSETREAQHRLTAGLGSPPPRLGASRPPGVPRPAGGHGASRSATGRQRAGPLFSCAGRGGRGPLGCPRSPQRQRRLGTSPRAHVQRSTGCVRHVSRRPGEAQPPLRAACVCSVYGNGCVTHYEVIRLLSASCLSGDPFCPVLPAPEARGHLPQRRCGRWGSATKTQSISAGGVQAQGRSLALVRLWTAAGPLAAPRGHGGGHTAVLSGPLVPAARREPAAAWAAGQCARCVCWSSRGRRGRGGDAGAGPPRAVGTLSELWFRGAPLSEASSALTPPARLRPVCTDPVSSLGVQGGHRPAPTLRGAAGRAGGWLSGGVGPGGRGPGEWPGGAGSTAGTEGVGGDGTVAWAGLVGRAEAGRSEVTAAGPQTPRAMARR